jgi:hypothetical protein
MTVSSVFATIAAAIKAIPIIDSWFAQIVAAWMQNQTRITLSEITDAASLAARAETDEQRYIAAEKWRQALSKTRILP